ncbi:MAG: NEW3 domain-containing protein [Niabella sp.]
MLAKQKTRMGCSPLLHGAWYSLLLVLGLSFSYFASAQKPPSGKTTFTARLVNLEAAANEVFRYNITLQNGYRQSLTYDLNAQMPTGWSVSFKVDGSQVTSYRLDSNGTKDISVEITPGPFEKPGKFKIPVKAISNTDTSTVELEAVVKGSYKVELSTQTGRLSDEVTEGSTKEIHLVIKNAGSIDLTNLELSAQSPQQWEANFEPSKIDKLEAGRSQDVVVKLKVPGKTIVGDYVTTFKIKENNANAEISYRMTVTTSFLSGWVGILAILLAIGIIYYLIRKYGRR